MVFRNSSSSIKFINHPRLLPNMGILVYIEKENQSKVVQAGKGMNVAEVLRQLKVNPVTVIVSRNDEIVVEDDKLYDGDSLKIISVISGG